MLWFSLQFLSETFFILRRTERDTIINVCILVWMGSTRYSCQILVQLQFFRQIFEKYSYIKFHENPSSGSRVFPCGQTGTHDVTSSLLTILRTRLKTSYLYVVLKKKGLHIYTAKLNYMPLTLGILKGNLTGTTRYDWTFFLVRNCALGSHRLWWMICTPLL